MRDILIRFCLDVGMLRDRTSAITQANRESDIVLPQLIEPATDWYFLQVSTRCAREEPAVA